MVDFLNGILYEDIYPDWIQFWGAWFGTILFFCPTEPKITNLNPTPHGNYKMHCYKMKKQNVYIKKHNKQMLQNDEPSMTTKNIEIKRYYKMAT